MALERPGATVSCVFERRASQEPREPPAPETGPHDEAGDRPDGRVGRILVAAAFRELRALIHEADPEIVRGRAEAPTESNPAVRPA